MEMCHREGLYQIDLLNGSKERITEREYWAAKKGQLALDKENAVREAAGQPTKPTKFETDKAKLRRTIRQALSQAGSFDEFSSLLLREGVTVKESRGRLSYLTPDRTKPITARKLGDDFDKAAVLALLTQNAHRAAEQTKAIPEYPHTQKGRLREEKAAKTTPADNTLQRMVDREAKRAEGKGVGYDRWAAKHNLTGETTTEEEDYEYYILNVKLRNKGLNSVISNSGLSEDDMERYRILLQTRGNRPDIFGNDIYATPGGEYTDYDIPGEALTDTRFANMIREAEKYLGYPYVWGGSSPSTSFDCSGFVSYVINHCGNGWSVGRLTANGLMGVCDIIPKSSAKPGDLIFFQGTYDTSGASHVGIYVGNGMMIHCGNPISYASIESNYWQQHFYCFGRIRN